MKVPKRHTADTSKRLSLDKNSSALKNGSAYSGVGVLLHVKLWVILIIQTGISGSYVWYFSCWQTLIVTYLTMPMRRASDYDMKDATSSARQKRKHVKKTSPPPTESNTQPIVASSCEG